MTTNRDGAISIRLVCLVATFASLVSAKALAAKVRDDAALNRALHRDEISSWLMTLAKQRRAK